MKRFMGRGGFGTSGGQGLGSAWRVWVALLVSGWMGWAAQAAPTVTSVTPANGATGVSVTQTISFMFSEAMDDSVSAVPSFPPFLVGNLEITPTSVFQNLSCDWSTDSKTLNCEVNGELPASTKISWKLNPAGATVPFTNAGGAAAATASGSFTTGTAGGGGGGGGEGAPKLVSSTPADGAASVPVTAGVTFVFDQAMTPNPQLGGFPPFVKGAIDWSGTGVDAAKFTYSWSADGKTLTCDYSGDLPGTTKVGWTLNPSGGVVQLTSKTGEVPLATVSGGFTTGAGGSGGGNEDCNQNEVPDDWGSYGFSKSAQYQQYSAADPTLLVDSKPSASSVVMSAPTNAVLTSGSLTLPNGTRKDLTKFPLGNMLMVLEEFETVAALETAYPGGAYILRFQQTGLAERVIPMSLPAGNPPVPKVANYDAAQNIDPAANFTLTWNAFTGAAAGSDIISLSIRDGSKIVFSAPNPCIPRELPVTATQIVIPAGTLSAAKVYDAELSFDHAFYTSSNTVPKMYGYGAISRSTQFQVATKGAVLPPAAARFVGYRLSATGKPELTFTGTAGRTYTLERATDPAGPSWTVAGTATVGADGQAVFTDPAPGAFPVYYRALGQ